MTARAEADQIIAAAKVKSFEIVGVARDLADSELTAERNRVATATEVWNGSRASLAAQLASLDASLSAYRTELAATAGAVADATQLGDAVPAGDVPPGAESSNAAMAAPVPGDAPMRSSRSGSAVSAGPSAAFAVGSTHQQRAGVFGR